MVTTLEMLLKNLQLNTPIAVKINFFNTSKNFRQMSCVRMLKWLN